MDNYMNNYLEFAYYIVSDIDLIANIPFGEIERRCDIAISSLDCDQGRVLCDKFGLRVKDCEKKQLPLTDEWIANDGICKLRHSRMAIITHGHEPVFLKNVKVSNKAKEAMRIHKIRCREDLRDMCSLALGVFYDMCTWEDSLALNGKDSIYNLQYFGVSAETVEFLISKEIDTLTKFLATDPNVIESYKIYFEKNYTITEWQKMDFAQWRILQEKWHVKSKSYRDKWFMDLPQDIAFFLSVNKMDTNSFFRKLKRSDLPTIGDQKWAKVRKIQEKLEETYIS